MPIRKEHLSYLALPFVCFFLFWSTPVAAGLLLLATLHFLYVRGLFPWAKSFALGLFGKKVPAPSTAPSLLDTEKTLITIVFQAPYELLGIDKNAGTGTIFRSFHQQAKQEQGDNLKFSRKGKRLAAAKNEMLMQRRKKGSNPNQIEKVERSEKKQAVENSLLEILESRPIYNGKVVQWKNLSPLNLESYQVGKEIQDVGSTVPLGQKEVAGKGNCRLVIFSQSGRLLPSAGEGQVVFLPGTKFVILSRTPWKNPNQAGAAEGFSFEIAEVA